ncbi:MAG: transposase [Arsenophonus sp. NEOnobi-MAG3]
MGKCFYIISMGQQRTSPVPSETLTKEAMIGGYISHIPRRHFKMVRYYSFFLNHKKGKLLQKVLRR